MSWLFIILLALPLGISGEAIFLPPSVDWRTEGVVSPVVDQGPFGRGYFHAVAAAIESFRGITTGQMTRLSQAQLFDCCDLYGALFECVVAYKGLCSYTDYPSPHYQSKPCHRSNCTAVATINGYKNVTKGDELALMEAVLLNPVAVVVNGEHHSYINYTGGIYDDPKCTDHKLSHAMLLVGYGTAGTIDYWILQNTWGESWGLKGYMLMARNKGNRCGIASEARFPV